jgi:hypothetical protein
MRVDPILKCLLILLVSAGAIKAQETDGEQRSKGTFGNLLSAGQVFLDADIGIRAEFGFLPPSSDFGMSFELPVQFEKSIGTQGAASFSPDKNKITDDSHSISTKSGKAIFWFKPSVAWFGAQDWAAVDDAVTSQGRITWSAPEKKEKYPEARDLEDFEGRAPIESRPRGVFGRIQHYVGTHKELLLADTLVWLGQGADAASTLHCIEVSTACRETNPIVGSRPNALQLVGGVFLAAGGVTTLNHLAWHFAPQRHIIWAWSGLLIVRNGIATYHNIEGTQRLQEARARLAQ